MVKRTTRWRAALSALTAFAMTLSLAPTPLIAEEADAVPEWAVDDGGAQDEGLAPSAELPHTYDLRNDGLVTPVKYQNPWNSCWAFGGTAAAESSLLSAYGSTYADSGLDLSERHLAWFALHPVTEDVNPDQAGEGTYTMNDDLNACFDAGGSGLYITTLFAQGVGPVTEGEFPYRGKDAMTTLDYFNEHVDEGVQEQIESEAERQNPPMSAEEYIRSKMADEPQRFPTEQALRDFYAERLREVYTEKNTYSKHDDWSIPATDEDGRSNRLLSAGVVLKDGNVLPSYHGADGAPNDACVTAMKQELLNGRGVSIMYYADQSGDYVATSEEGGQQYAQYIDTPKGIDHTVCVVGWDDGYSKENFKEGCQPPENGAWIVKNSWGSTSDAGPDELGNVVNRSEYGIKNEKGEYTGYFYLSYYDKTIAAVETMDFSANLGAEGGFYTMQHDYMPAFHGFKEIRSDDGVMSSANVFEAQDDMLVKSVSTLTPEENMRTTLAVYVLDDGAKGPTEGTMAYRTSRNFEYAGFHRLDLDRPVKVARGKRVAVVSTASTVGEDGKRHYGVSANQGASFDLAQERKYPMYQEARVNEGESFLYQGGQWRDWSDVLAESSEGFPVDNFSIKLYAEPTDDVPVTVTYGAHVQSRGDVPEVSNGATCGTTGESKRVEAVWARASEGSIEYRSHVQGVGWEDSWARDGEVSGTVGESRRVEAIQMRLSGADGSHVWYRVHSQACGWLGWACDGEPAGTAGLSRRVEAYEVLVLGEGEQPEGYDPERPAYVSTTSGEAHVQGVGWQRQSADVLGTTGQSRRLEAVGLSLAGQPWEGGIAYEVHAQGVGWMPEAADGARAGTTGESRRLEAVRVRLTGEGDGAAAHLSVWYRVHSQTFGWLGWAHDGADAGTTGLSKRAEAVEVQVLPQGQVPADYDAAQAAFVTK